MKGLSALIRGWRERRRDLAFLQLEHPDNQHSWDAVGDREVSAARAEGGLFRRATRAKSRSEWRGD